MFDYKKVSKLGMSAISLDGETVYSTGLITSEQEKEEAKIASLVYEDAIFDFASSNQEEYSFEEACKEVIARYGLNGEVNDNSENKAIREILDNNYLTIDLQGSDLVHSPYRILSRTEKGRRDAVLRYKAKQMGFDIQNLKVEYDIEKRNFHISYDKIPLVKTNKSVFDMTPQEKYDYALEQEKEASDEETANYWREVRAHINFKYTPLSPSNKDSYTENTNFTDVITAQSDEANIATTPNTKELFTLGEPLLKQSDSLYPYEKEVEEYYDKFQSAIRNKDYAFAKACAENAKNIILEHPIVMPLEKWNNLSPEEKVRFNHLKVMEAAVFGKKEEFDYWVRIYRNSKESLPTQPQNGDNLQIQMTPQR